MTTLALITMLTAQGIIIAATLYFYKLVLKKPNSGGRCTTSLKRQLLVFLGKKRLA